MALKAAPGALRTPASSASAMAAALRSADAERLRRYATYLDFYNGKQWAKLRPGRTNLVVNYSRSIVDKGISYLLGRGVGFEVVTGVGVQGAGVWEGRGTVLTPTDPGSVGRVPCALPPGTGKALPSNLDAAGDEPPPYGTRDRAEELLQRVYEDNDLEAVDAQGAINGAVLGDTVFKVYWEGTGRGDGKKGRWGEGEGGTGGRIRVVNIDPFTFFPRWAVDDPSTLVSVDVAYRLPAGEREMGQVGEWGRSLTHHPLTPSLALPLVDVVERWTDEEFVLTVGDREAARSANPYGFIPFVHIPNVRPANEFWGVSDLRDVLPLNRELNERMSDMADVIRFHSDPPVVFKGVREHSDLEVGPGTVWDLPEGAEVELLEWRGQSPAVHEHIERVMRALHDVAETPKTAFGDSGRLLSGVALETELQPLIQKTLRKRIWWSAGLRRRNRCILRIAELMGMGSFAPYRTRVVWPELVRTDGMEEKDGKEGMGRTTSHPSSPFPPSPPSPVGGY